MLVLFTIVVAFVEYLSLVKFAYNNSYHTSIGKAPFEALYGKRYKSLIGLFELDKTEIFCLDLVYQTMEIAKFHRVPISIFSDRGT